MIYNYKDPDELHMDMDIWKDARQQALSGKRTTEQYPKSRNFRGRGTTIMITIKELYEKAKANGSENYKIQLQCQDQGGTYPGTVEMDGFDIDKETEEITLF